MFSTTLMTFENQRSLSLSSFSPDPFHLHPPNSNYKKTPHELILNIKSTYPTKWIRYETVHYGKIFYGGYV